MIQVDSCNMTSKRVDSCKLPLVVRRRRGGRLWEAVGGRYLRNRRGTVLGVAGRQWRGLSSPAAISVSVRNPFATGCLHFVPVKWFSATVWLSIAWKMPRGRSQPGFVEQEPLPRPLAWPRGRKRRSPFAPVPKSHILALEAPIPRVRRLGPRWRGGDVSVIVVVS